MDGIRELEFQRSMISDEEYEPFKIVFYYNGKNVLFGFHAQGETGFSQYGLDIVAAGVSALIINAINSIRLLTNELVEDEFQRNYAKCMLPNLRNNKISKEALILLKSLRMGIESIQETYGEKYILIEEVRETKKGSIFNIFK